jgi:hypothetical protein
MLPRPIMLDWLPTPALKEFIEAHWYYLPESIHKDTKAWMLTMQELLCELNSRNLKVTLTITDTEN